MVNSNVAVGNHSCGMKKKTVFGIVLLCCSTVIIITALNSNNKSCLISANVHKRPSFNTSVSSTDSTSEPKGGKKPRILCMILTHQKYIDTRAAAVNITWGPKCTKYIFAMSKPVPKSTLPIVELPVEDSYKNLWEKVRQLLIWAHDKHLNDFDFFFKVDDDAYIVYENLEKHFQQYDPNKILWTGRHFRMIVEPSGYLSGGAGYVMSRETLRVLVTKGFRSTHPSCISRPEKPEEDCQMGRCMQYLKIPPTDAVDKENKELFHPFSVDYLMDIKRIYPSKTFWYYLYNHDKNIVAGLDCCSKWPISFHNIEHRTMLALHFLMYRMIPPRDQQNNKNT